MVQILLLNYFSIATMTFRIALIKQSYHGVYSLIKLNMLHKPIFPKQSQMRLMVLSHTLKNVIF